ncbi:MAG: DUF4131 domain-containing protein [Leptolyngbyaceae cyanobacterium CRU_2_3]|nr:DUF4131 domain-containing protein [Leptolyngbyaceae cyanobacterium CRU_2_3]
MLRSRLTSQRTSPRGDRHSPDRGDRLFLVPRVVLHVLPQWRRSAPQSWVWLVSGLIGLLAVMYFQIRLPQPTAQDICRLIKSSNDGICQPIATATSPAFGQVFEITGTISTAPRLTRSDRYQFQLEALEVRATSPDQALANPSVANPSVADKIVLPLQAIAGSVYVTIPRSTGEALYPGQQVVIFGSLYKPKPAASPGGFNFQTYLAQEGIFTGLIGQEISLSKGQQPQPPLLWSVQRRIIRSQEVKLGITEGHLISAMVMGKSAVDVPYELQDQFRQAGLAHALAASGAQVSLLIGVILALTQRWPAHWRLGAGSTVIAGYIGLTGIEPSVLRAGVMGGIVLFAMVAERQVKPLGSLLIAAVVLLVWNPLWIWHLGFQLSFLATLGLLITVPVITQKLDWMPSAIAPLFAVPLAAYLWTIPLQLFSFGVVSPYSILVNILVSPLIAIISLGGMVSAVAALLLAPAGSGLAWLLHYPTWLFIKIAEVSNDLPGSQYAVGTINVAQVLMLYGLIVLIWRWQRSHIHWWLALILGISLVAVPAWATATNLLQVTVLPTSTTEPVLVIQDRGNVILVNSGNEKDSQFTILPFLQKQGINQIDWAIAPRLQASDLAGWQKILETVPIHRFYNNPVSVQVSSSRTAFGQASSGQISSGRANSQVKPGQVKLGQVKPGQVKPGQVESNAEMAIAFPRLYREFLGKIKAQQGSALQLSSQQLLKLGSLQLKLLAADASAFHLQIGNQDWLFLNRLRSGNSRPSGLAQLPQAQVLWWTGKELHPQILEQVKPKVAIAPKLGLPAFSPTKTWFEQWQVELYAIEQTGSIQWQPDQGFSTALSSSQES